MPTIPRLPDGEPHQARRMAESFGVDAERYDRTRPRYPDDLVARIIAGSPGRRVLDVGTGTGIVARQFQTAGCTVLGVEPDPRMAAFARRRGLDAEVAKFEDWDPAGRTFDAVVAGQAWHWVDPEAGAARAAQVLRPGGRLAAFWYVAQTPPDVTSAFSAAYADVLPGPVAAVDQTRTALDGYSSFFTRAADGIRRTDAFDDPEQWHFTWDHRYTRDEWLDQVPTSGMLTRLPPAQLETLLAGLGAALDTVGGAFTMQYTAVAVTATRQARSDAQPSPA